VYGEDKEGQLEFSEKGVGVKFESLEASEGPGRGSEHLPADAPLWALDSGSF
jgi:hypothetical protein